jgi:HKD family nuclease
MRVQLIDNVSRDMATALPPVLEHSQDIRIAVAFVSQRGLALIDSALTAAIQAGATAEFLVGLDMQSTEPQALKALLDRSRETACLSLYCYASVSAAGIYHPKLYVFRAEDQVTSIVGSSNLTEGGLKKNVEVNVRIEATVGDELVSDIYATYGRLKFLPERVEPDDEFLALYAELCQRQRVESKSASRDASTLKLMASFREKAKTLRRPVPSRRDLVGWLELVYDALPDGEFTNELVYAQEPEFRKQYPDNLNVRAKVRQQLQVLRDMGLIEHIARGHWRKK